MGELAVRLDSIPVAIEDLSKFVLIGREKMAAVRAEIRAIDKLNLAEVVRQQKLEEAQMMAEAVLDAEVRLGELTAQIPKNERARTDLLPDTAVAQTKTQVIRKLGFTSKQVERFEKLARHPEIVEQVKAEARERQDIISRAAVLSKIEQKTKSHFTYSTGNFEWYTPKEYIEAARQVMGTIDLDPASCAIANEVVQADTYYTIEQDGLTKPWKGRVWLNPPYADGLIQQFANKLKAHIDSGDISEAIVLVNNTTETNWFNTFVSCASAIVFTKGRVKFYFPNRQIGNPLQGQAVLYCGPHPERFLEVFKAFGWGALI